MNVNQISAAHTAEHIFVGTLQKIIDDVIVVKVDQDEHHNVVVLKSSKLTWNSIEQAEIITNDVISQSLEVKTTNYDDLASAKLDIPTLRSMDAKISGTVSVVSIGEYDYSACNKKHTENSIQCELFVITDFMKTSEEVYDIKFEVGNRAKKFAIINSNRSIQISKILNAPFETLIKNIENLKTENELLTKNIRSITLRELSAIKPSVVNNVNFYNIILENCDRKKLQSWCSSMIKSNSMFLQIADKSADTMLVICRSDDVDVNVNEIISEFMKKYGGKGGGRENFVVVKVEGTNSEEFFENLKNDIINVLKSIS